MGTRWPQPAFGRGQGVAPKAKESDSQAQLKRNCPDGPVRTAAPIGRYRGAFRLIWLQTAGTAAQRWRFSLSLLLLGYFAAGIFGRFPWKADEPHSFGMIWEILEENQWLVLQIADQPFVEKPPLVY